MFTFLLKILITYIVIAQLQPQICRHIIFKKSIKSNYVLMRQLIVDFNFRTELERILRISVRNVYLLLVISISGDKNLTINLPFDAPLTCPKSSLSQSSTHIPPPSPIEWRENTWQILPSKQIE